MCLLLWASCPSCFCFTRFGCFDENIQSTGPAAVHVHPLAPERKPRGGGQATVMSPLGQLPCPGSSSCFRMALRDRTVTSKSCRTEGSRQLACYRIGDSGTVKCANWKVVCRLCCQAGPQHRCAQMSVKHVVSQAGRRPSALPAAPSVFVPSASCRSDS